MDFEMVECVGTLPWAGFIFGCVALAVVIVVFAAIFAEKLWKWLKQTTFGQWCKNKKAARKQKRKEKQSAIPYEERRRKEKQIDFTLHVIGIVFKTIGYSALTVLACWMLWGFVRVIICLSQN